MITTGGGTRDVGKSRAGEAFEEDSTGCEAWIGVDPAMSSEPPRGVEIVGDGKTVVYSVLVTTTGELDVEPVVTKAVLGCLPALDVRVELVAAELSGAFGGITPVGAEPG